MRNHALQYWLIHQVHLPCLIATYQHHPRHYYFYQVVKIVFMYLPVPTYHLRVNPVMSKYNYTLYIFIIILHGSMYISLVDNSEEYCNYNGIDDNLEVGYIMQFIIKHLV